MSRHMDKVLKCSRLYSISFFFTTNKAHYAANGGFAPPLALLQDRVENLVENLLANKADQD